MTNSPAQGETPDAPKPGAAGDGNLAVPMKLRDFLEGVATIYDLPEQERRKARAAHPLKKKAPIRIPKARLNLLLGAAAVTSLLWALDGIRKPPAEFGILPVEINGGWHTNDARYRNRAFWIKGNLIAFQTGKDSMEVTVHKITQVDQKILSGDTLQYTLQYLADGAPITWAIKYSQRPKPTIRFVNQRELVWTPAPRSSWPTP